MVNSNNAVDYYHNSRIFCNIDQKIHLHSSFRRVEAVFYNSIFMHKIWGKVYPYKCKIYCILEKKSNFISHFTCHPEASSFDVLVLKVFT